MCGIAGIVDLSGSRSPEQLRKLVRKMADRIAHRGPDDSGEWVSPDGRVAFSHRRLSIIDTSSAGKQPMIGNDRKSAITFNGEIYNYLDLRKVCERAGGRLRTHTDTEVLLELLCQQGASVIKSLDGMFAFAFYDGETRELLFARDPFGEKPLYYMHSHGALAFASEVHSLMALPWFDSTIDAEAIAEYFAFQYVPAPRSIYAHVKKLPPGCVMRLNAAGTLHFETHFSFTPLANPSRNQSMDALVDELRDILVRSTERRLMSDVPLGCFLSGGVDSSATVAVVTQELKRSVKTFSLGCPNSDESEHIFARQMAERLGAEHNEFLVTPNIPVLVHKIARLLDEPLADSSCLPTYMLSEFSRRQVTVLLSGDGGDEMFGGYGRYFSTLQEEQKKLQGDPHYATWQASDGYFGSRIMIFNVPELTALMGEIPPETRAGFEAYKAKLNDPGSPLLSRLRAIDMANYLPGAVLAKVDRMSMQHALEVRTPFLNREIAAFAEKLAPEHLYLDGQGKVILKDYVNRFVPREWLDRRKQGFGVPIHLWDRVGCLKTLRRLVLGSGALTQHWVGRKNLESFVQRQESPGTFSAYQVWSVLILEIWLRSHLISNEDRSVERGPVHQLIHNSTARVQSIFSLG